MKYNLTTLNTYFKQERKFKIFCKTGLKYRKIVLKSVLNYIWFGKGLWDFRFRCDFVLA